MQEYIERMKEDQIHRAVLVLPKKLSGPANTERMLVRNTFKIEDVRFSCCHAAATDRLGRNCCAPTRAHVMRMFPAPLQQQHARPLCTAAKAGVLAELLVKARACLHERKCVLQRRHEREVCVSRRLDDISTGWANPVTVAEKQHNLSECTKQSTAAPTTHGGTMRKGTARQSAERNVRAVPGS